MDLMSHSIKSAQQEQHIRNDELNALCIKVKTKGFQLKENVPYDGDCLFSSVVMCLKRKCRLDAHSLRQALAEYFSSTEVC